MQNVPTIVKVYVDGFFIDTLPLFDLANYKEDALTPKVKERVGGREIASITWQHTLYFDFITVSTRLENEKRND